MRSPSKISIKLEQVPCNLCGSTNFKTLFKRFDSATFFRRHHAYTGAFNVVQCNECGMVFVNPRPKIKDMFRFYESSYYDDMLDPKLQERRYKEELKYISGIPRGRLLDVGCSTGAFMKIAQGAGWDVYGTDLFSSQVKSNVRSKVRFGDFSKLKYPPNYFDVVTSWAVFEHLQDPYAYFRKVYDVLKPGGTFVFLVTNINSVASGLAYEDDIPRHLNLFSKDTVNQYLKRVGFANARFSFNDKIFNFDGTSLFKNRILRLFMPDYEIEASHRFYTVILRKLLSFLGILLIKPTVPIQKALGYYGIMVVTCEKPKA